MAYKSSATSCDVLGCYAFAEKYSQFPFCRECLDRVCPAHQVPDSLDEETGKCLCGECKLVHVIEHLKVLTGPTGPHLGIDCTYWLALVESFAMLELLSETF